jgi:CD2 antigen cytoplasmic tail-binding protein 2
MSSSTRFGAARPKRAAEEFVRTHQFYSDGPPPAKNPRFDVRNPSALAPDIPEEDAILEADVIGGGGAGTKRNAVNLDGYDSDSDNDCFDARAEERGKQKKGDVNLFEQLENYGNDDLHRNIHMEEEEDMYIDLDEEIADEGESGALKPGKEAKAVRFLEEDEIEGQVLSSKSGGHVSGDFALDLKGKRSLHAMGDQESSDDEEDAALAAQEEDIDEEVGAGGLKRNAPKVDAFNMKAEQEEGRFDAAGNYVRKATDPDAIHDSWLEGVSKKQIKKAAKAHEKREAEQRQKRLEDDAMLTTDLLRTLILRLEKGESVLDALARLGKDLTKTKKIPKWKLKKQKGADGGTGVDATNTFEDNTQAKIREAVDAITGAADRLLTRGQMDIYDQEREMLIRQYRRETGEDWVEMPVDNVIDDWHDGTRPIKMWEYRWTDGRDNSEQGPYDGATMIAWQNAGYFGDGVEFRRAGEEGTWSRLADFV